MNISGTKLPAVELARIRISNHHRFSQQCFKLRSAVAEHGIVCSMSRKGNCWDNAPMESFFHTLKTELVHHRDYQTRDEARHDIFEFVEVFYNRQRSHSTLGYLSPVQFEVTALAA